MTSKPHRPWWRRILKWLTITVVSLLILAILAWSIAEYVTTKQLNAEIARIREAGEPLTLDDLAVETPDDPANDAARYYAAAMALARMAPWDHDVQDALRKTVRGNATEPLSEEQLAAARRTVAENRHMLEMLNHASSLEECHFDTGIEEGLAVAMDRVRGARAAATHLLFRSDLRNVGGDIDGAMDDAMAVLAMRRIFGHQRTLVAHLMRMSVVWLASQHVEAVLATPEVSDEMLIRLAEGLEDAEEPDGFVDVLMAERVYGLELMGEIVQPGQTVQYSPRFRRLLPERMSVSLGGRPLYRWWAVEYVRDMNQFIEAARQPWPHRIYAMKSVQSGGLLTSPLTPAFGHGIALEASSVATTRAARVAVLVELCRRQHGQLPDELGELVPEFVDVVPIDPFTGKPMTYRIEDHGYAIYGVGDDGQDNGGHFIGGSGEERDFGVRITWRDGR